MPTYQYACTDCGADLEIRQSFQDEPLSVCPRCDGRLRKVFGAVGVVFKGSGFYRTDSRAAEVKSGTNGDRASGAKDGKKPGAEVKSGDTGSAPKAAAESGSGTESAA